MLRVHGDFKCSLGGLPHLCKGKVIYGMFSSLLVIVQGIDDMAQMSGVLSSKVSKFSKRTIQMVLDDNGVFYNPDASRSTLLGKLQTAIYGDEVSIESVMDAAAGPYDIE
jgi:hypothetical protein